MKTSSNIKTVLFDILVAIATFFLAELFAFFSSAFISENREEGLELSIYIAVPLWAILFYLIRRQFDWRMTIIQIVITSITTLLLIGIIIKSSDNFPNFITHEFSFLLPLLVLSIFILIKHVTDRFIARKYYSS
jgi:hypothetical protein